MIFGRGDEAHLMTMMTEDAEREEDSMQAAGARETRAKADVDDGGYLRVVQQQMTTMLLARRGQQEAAARERQDRLRWMDLKP
jgi:hypothetical protein